ncbi:hypothetical protein [Methylotuvimicrobium sp. KM2]|uniref:COG4648 family protein n=1 Tax=Methylotuvimicrobium sp. KM2 TaxID=3133976 RepID=UPI003101850F
MRKWLNGAIGVLMLLYPLAVYYGIQSVQPWQIAMALAALLLVRLVCGRTNGAANQVLIIAALLFCGVAVWNNDEITLRFYPALMNLSLLLVFASSLYFPPPMIERLARLQHPDLPPQGVLYTRRVTQVWCVFFLLNGLIAAATAVWCSFTCWSLYNGLLAYVLMGLLMAIEYWVRIRTQGHVR